MNARSIFAAAFAVVALAGCAADPTDAATESADLTADAKLPQISGSFVSAGAETLGLPTSLTFAADGTYEAGSEHGTWTLAKAAKQLQITLSDSAGEKKTYFWSLGGNTMTFNETLSGATAYFYDTSWTKRIPIGGLCEDAKGKSLGECSDSGNFGCSGFDSVMTCNPLD